MSNCTLTKIEIHSFGKLKQTVLSPSAGLLVLTAPNESGKSTLAAFLRFVFYGFPDSRKKELSENDKKLYTPWDSPVSEGSVTLQKDGAHYRVFRSVQGTKETCTVTHTETGRVLPVSENVGEYFFGVSEEVFSRALFYKQLTVPQSKDGVMAEQLQNIAVSADEQVGSRRAMELLTKAKNELKGRAGNGRIPKLERDCIQLENEYRMAVQERETLEQLRTEQEAQRTRLLDNETRTEKVKDELFNLSCVDAANQLQKLNDIRCQAEQAEQAYLEAKAVSGDVRPEALSRLSLLYTAHTLAVSRTEQAKKELEREEPAPVLQQTETVPASGGHLPMVLSALGVALGVGLLFVWWMVGAMALALSAMALVWSFLSASKKKRALEAEQAKNRAEAEAANRVREAARQGRLSVYETARKEQEKGEGELTEALRPFGLALDEHLPGMIRTMEQACRETARLEAAFASASRSVDIAFGGVDLSALEELAAQAKEPARDRASAERELRFLESQANTLGEQARRTEMQIAAMEAKDSDPGILLGKWQAVQALLLEYRRKYTAYEDALAGIAEASDQMKRMVSPRIAKLAETYFAAATDGKYASLSVDTRLSMEITDASGVSRDCDYLSAGARDAVYLCLRLALTELMYGSAGMPMVLDDAFGRLDDDRLRSMLRVLAKAAEKHQVFLFCCTNREEALLRESGIPFTTLEL